MINDGEIYNPGSPAHRECLRLAQCYVDMSVNPPVIRVINNKDDYEILGWVWLKSNGELKSYGVKVELSFDKRHFIYKGVKYGQGLYFLIKRNGSLSLVPEELLD